MDAIREARTVQHLEEAAEQRLRSHGIRFTQGRRSVVRAISQLAGPRTAAEIHRATGDDVPLSSLYRSLAVLTDGGVLSSQHGSGGVIRFELAEWFTGHHHHLVCGSCGSVIDVVPSPSEEEVMQSLIDEIGRDAGFEVSGHRFEIEGTCRDCR